MGQISGIGPIGTLAGPVAIGMVEVLPSSVRKGGNQVQGADPWGQILVDLSDVLVVPVFHIVSPG